MKTLSTILLCASFSAFAGGLPDRHEQAFGPLYKANPQATANLKSGPRKGLDVVRRWNQIAIDAAGLDHTPVAPGETRVFGEQIGPCRSSRAIAIVHSDPPLRFDSSSMFGRPLYMATA